MTAFDKMILNTHIVSGFIKRIGDRYIIYPWSFKSKDEYESLILAMEEDYNFVLTKEGLVANPKP